MTSSPLFSVATALLQTVVVVKLSDGRTLRGTLITAAPRELTLEMGPNEKREHVKLPLENVLEITAVN